MSVPRKIRSALGLAARLDFAGLGRQWRRHRRQSRLRLQGTTAFVHQEYGFPVVCHPDWPDSAAQYLDGPSDLWEFRLLRAWLQPGDQFLDLGANTGLYSYAAWSAVAPGGLVVAVDAAPYVTAQIAAGARRLAAPNLHAVQAAVTEASGEITFHVRPDHALTTEQSLRPDPRQLAGSVAVNVPARTLADLAGTEALGPELAAVKMDIEGAEAAALRAAPSAWFTADGPFWIVEINPGALARFQVGPPEILARFPDSEFVRWLLPKHPHDPRVHPALRPARTSDRFDDSIYYNLFALPRGARGRRRASRVAAFFPAGPNPAD
jgi:FkbM family methyltransferase